MNDEDSTDFFFNEKEARTMLKFGEVGENEVFCDLGSGDGITVCMAVHYSIADLRRLVAYRF